MPIEVYRTARHYLLTECRIARRHYHDTYGKYPLDVTYRPWFDAANRLADLRAAVQAK